MDSPGGSDPFLPEGDDDATDQVGRDLRDSAEMIRMLLHDAFQRLRKLDSDSPVTALVGQAVERFQQVYLHIDGLASDLGLTQSADRREDERNTPS